VKHPHSTQLASKRPKKLALPTSFLAALRSEKQSWLAQLDYEAVFLLRNLDTHTTLLALGQEDALTLTADEKPFEKLETFAQNDWAFCALSYDLKNSVENLKSREYNPIALPDLVAVRPQWVFKLHGGQISCCKQAADGSALRWNATPQSQKGQKVKLQPRISRERYLSDLDRIMQHIQRGDIYEINYCQEFFAEEVSIDPVAVFDRLSQLSHAPHSAYMHFDNKHVLCASPERFLRRKGEALISQPIKGTAARDTVPTKDAANAAALLNSQKERSEHVMITDLVRNDMSKIAQRGSVGVDELFGIYSFPTVHQMISTVRANLHPDYGWKAVFEALFPMGSMTGAPKVSAMQIIDRLEASRRGLYSGSIGYIDPNGDGDFNVVIRSLIYNAKNGYLSASAGGAVTTASDPEKEYEESLLKLEALFRALED